MRNKDFSYYLSHFLKDYLVVERNCSKHTIRSYKNTFKQLIEYLVNIKNIRLQNINFNTTTRDIIIEFLNYLETVKNISIRTRNQRLAAIKSFYQYCLYEEIDNVDNINKVLSIKVKKTPETIVDYLTEEEFKKFWDSIDKSSKIGFRDYVLIVLLYDTGARANEIRNLKLEDIRLAPGYIILNGKGKKQRVVQVMDNTKALLIKYIDIFKPKSYLFNNNGNKHGKNFIFKICVKYSNIIPMKKITPHTIRRTRATHLLEHSVPIVHIQELLGHSSVQTTQSYAKVMEKTKFEAIKKVTPNYKDDNFKDWNDDKDLLSLLINL